MWPLLFKVPAGLALGGAAVGAFASAYSSGAEFFHRRQCTSFKPTTGKATRVDAERVIQTDGLEFWAPRVEYEYEVENGQKFTSDATLFQSGTDPAQQQAVLENKRASQETASGRFGIGRYLDKPAHWQPVEVHRTKELALQSALKEVPGGQGSEVQVMYDPHNPKRSCLRCETCVTCVTSAAFVGALGAGFGTLFVKMVRS